MTLTRKQRFENILTGQKVDRSIVSGWHHFLDKEHTAHDLAEATIEFATKYDWDWVKINPRATYLAEIFGNTYDLNDYRWVFPRQTDQVIQQTEDVWKLKKVEVSQSAPLLEQLEAVRKIRLGLPETPIIQTLFSPLTILMFLTGNSSYVDQTMYGSEKPLSIKELFATQRTGVHYALNVIANTMAEYVKALEEAGADGVFYAVTGTAHPDLFDEAAFNEYSRPYDMIVLNAMQKGKKILHTCGTYAQPSRFNDYPVEGISWDTVAEGNPGLDVELEKVKVAGVDHHVFTDNNVALIRKQAAEAQSIMKGEPFLLVPNCAVSVHATEEALKELKNSVL